jgi:hypothetical protein
VASLQQINQTVGFAIVCHTFQLVEAG